MKAFVKVQCDIVDRFETKSELLLYVCLLCLMDREGRIRMDSTALAARIQWKPETLQDVMTRLMRPNPDSRCKKYSGACVAFIDPDRPHLGFLIPAAVSHRKRNADTEARRGRRRDWMRKNRPSRAKNPANPQRGPKKLGWTGVNSGEHGVNSGELPLPGKKNSGELGVNSGEPKVNCDRDRDRDIYLNSKTGGTTTSPVGAPNFDLLSGPPDDEIHNVDQIVRFFCETIFKRGLRPNQVSQKTLQRLVEQLPLTRQQLSNLDDLFNWPDEDVRLFPELRDRKPVGLSYLIDNLGDYLTKAAQFVKHFDR